MNFNRTDDQRMLADTLSRYLQEQYSHDHRMQSAASPAGYSAETYRALCELGIAGAMLPESCGGYGGSGTDIAVVFEELGRALVVEPFLSSSVMCANLLNDLAAEQSSELISNIIDGNKTVSLAHYEPDARYALDQIQCTATLTDGHWILNGVKNQVINAGSADYLIVSARTGASAPSQQGISAFVLSATETGLTVDSHTTIDGYQTGTINLDQVQLAPTALLGTEGNGYQAIEKTIARGVIALCSEAVGAMTVCKDMTIEYLQTRKQFGVALGKFQVLQHRMVDALIELEQARSAVLNAALHLEHDRHARELQVSAAKNLIGRSAKILAEESIQMHGGIAMTWEYPLAHYAKRLIMIDHLLGDTDYHLQRFIDFSTPAEHRTT